MNYENMGLVHITLNVYFQGRKDHILPIFSRY